MEYLLLLFEQFNEIRGYKNIYVESKNYIDEFVDWIVLNKKIGKKFIELMKFNDVTLDESGVAEVNKGVHDRILNGVSISPFNSSFGEINSELLFYDDSPIIFSDEKNYIPNNIDLYFTHNPYSSRYVNKFILLHNNGCRICYGLFGLNTDKNLEKKIANLSLFKNECYEKCNVVYEKENEYYYIALYSQCKELVKNKLP